MEDVTVARCLVLGITFIATAVVGAKQPVTIRVSPAFSYAPANLVIQTSIEPADANDGGCHAHAVVVGFRTKVQF